LAIGERAASTITALRDIYLSEFVWSSGPVGPVRLGDRSVIPAVGLDFGDPPIGEHP
jgi:hypothetical protein